MIDRVLAKPAPVVEVSDVPLPGAGGRLLAEQMSVFRGQPNIVNASSASGVAADKVAALLPSYSAGTNSYPITF